MLELSQKKLCSVWQARATIEHRAEVMPGRDPEHPLPCLGLDQAVEAGSLAREDGAGSICRLSRIGCRGDLGASRDRRRILSNASGDRPRGRLSKRLGDRIDALLPVLFRGPNGHLLLAFQLGCVGIGVAATLQALYLLRTTGVFGPAYLEFLHKNFIGNTLAFSFLIALVRPRWLNWPTWFHLFVMVVSVLGIAASNSRQAVVSVFAGVAFLALRSWGRGATRRGRVLLLLLIPAVIATAGTVSEQLESGDAFNSTSQRLTWISALARLRRSSSRRVRSSSCNSLSCILMALE